MAETEARAFLAGMAMQPFGLRGRWLQLGIAERAGARLIGDIGLCLSAPGGPSQAEIGFTLARAWQGRGLAAEAVRLALQLLFGHSDIERVVAVSDARNAASIRLLCALGMRLVATEAALFRGEPCEEQHFELQRATDAGRGRAFPDFAPGA
jgi:RimJ/RimL family protein N-acetyltransferase